MPASFASLSQLPESERAQLEALLVAFDSGWSENRLKEEVRRLPPGNNPLRRLALLELVQIDLERQWQMKRKPQLEVYLDHYPELGTPDTVPAVLIQAEFEVRRQFNGTADLADFARRFPRQAEQLRQLLGVAPQPGKEKPPSSGPAPVDPEQTGEFAESGTAGKLPEAEALKEFGHYQIVRPLGGGGMGSVVLAWDTKLKRQVALKRPNLAGEGNHDEAVRRFHIEAEALAALNHPNICQVYEVSKVEGVPYLTMSFIEGSNLSDLIPQRRPLPPEQAVELVRKLALALQAAHEQGVVHRDLKPQNVRINKQGEPVIVDFGLALRVSTTDERLTRSGNVLGTLAYMPPEQALVDRDAMGPRCDVYSLGIVLYELLTGRTPFQGNFYEVMKQILEKDPDAPSKRCRAVGPRLDAICLKALAKKPEDRFKTMTEMAAALGEFLEAKKSPSTPKGPKDPKRSWLGKALTGALVLVMLLGAAGIWLSVKTKDGVIELTDLPPDAEVRVDGERVTVKWADGKVAEIGVKAGTPHEIEVKVNGVTVRGEKVTVTAGERKPFTVGFKKDPPTGPFANPRSNPGPQGPTVDRAKPAPLDCTGRDGVSPVEVQKAQKAWASYLKREIEETVEIADGVKMVFVLVPPGKFRMGSPEDESDRQKDETLHDVTLTEPFYLARYTVTQAEYEALIGNNPSHFKGARFPVECVRWKDAQDYADKLTKKRADNHLYRLPTEAEWEYSCRGGRPSSKPFGIGDGRTLSSREANFDGNHPYGGAAVGPYYTGFTREVGSYSSNALGLFDMHGNVEQWCADWYGSYPVGDVTNPAGPSEEGSDRVRRGGCFISDGGHCRAASRDKAAPWDRFISLGFRLARSLPSDSE